MVAPRVFNPPLGRFLVSSCQVEETLADLIDFLSLGFLSSFLSAAFLSAGRCKVPSLAFAVGAGSGALIGLRGVFIIALICATSSATALRACSVTSAFSVASLAWRSTFLRLSSSTASSPADSLTFLTSFSASVAACACASRSCSNLAKRSCFSRRSAS